MVDPERGVGLAATPTWVRRFAARRAALLNGPHSDTAIHSLQAYLANLRAGIGHHRAQALRTTGELFVMWVSICAVPEGMRPIRQALSAATPAAADRARGLIALSIKSFHAGDSPAALALAHSVHRSARPDVSGPRDAATRGELAPL
ncbi:hypothetical protein [Nocardia sp. NPDC051463]|uniref:hypothetical protein n=1 Tax=Nocardia sp. NPDC051463 TaxID=3154845 RepID=UPI003419C58E